MDKLAEFVGFSLVLGFLWFVWPPLVLLGAGLLLVAYANTRAHAGRLGAIVAASWSAARRAAQATREIDGETTELRRIA